MGRQKHRLTPDEKAVIRKYYLEKNSRELAEILGRSQKAVMHRIAALKRSDPVSLGGEQFKEYPRNDIFLIASD